MDDLSQGILRPIIPSMEIHFGETMKLIHFPSPLELSLPMDRLYLMEVDSSLALGSSCISQMLDLSDLIHFELL